MSRWAIYQTATGHIDRVFDGADESLKLNLYSGESAVELPIALTDVGAYVLNGVATPKQFFTLTTNKPQIIDDSIDEATITNIPAGTTVEWPDGQTDEVTDGEVRFSVDLPGTYILKFSAIPYLDQEVTLEAVSAT